MLTISADTLLSRNLFLSNHSEGKNQLYHTLLLSKIRDLNDRKNWWTIPLSNSPFLRSIPSVAQAEFSCTFLPVMLFTFQRFLEIPILISKTAIQCNAKVMMVMIRIVAMIRQCYARSSNKWSTHCATTRANIAPVLTSISKHKIYLQIINNAFYPSLTLHRLRQLFEAGLV